jgi:type VI secretion system protein ImpM
MAGEVGYFGKIPALGDFVQGRLPRGFREVWDPWLQAGLSESRAALGAGWLDRYGVAPIWRFALGPGLAGAAAAAGLMMPSQDRVGRFFPLTLVIALPATEAEAALADETAFAAWEAVALEALEAEGGLAAFAAGVASLAPPRGSAGPPLAGSVWQAATADGPLGLRHPALPPPALFATFLDLATGRWPGLAA